MFIAAHIPAGTKILPFITGRVREGDISSFLSAVVILSLASIALYVTVSGVLNVLHPEIESRGGSPLIRILSFPARLLPIRLETPKDRKASPYHEQIALTAHNAAHLTILAICIVFGIGTAAIWEYGFIVTMGISGFVSIYFLVTPHRWLSFWMPIADARGVDVPNFFGGSRFWDWSRTDLTVLGEQYHVALIRLDDTESDDRRYLWVCAYHLDELLGVRRAWEEQRSAPASA